MASLVRAIYTCIFGEEDCEVAFASEDDVMAADILSTLFGADEGGRYLQKTVQGSLGQRGWTENIAKAILGGIENAFKRGIQMGKVMQEVSKKANDEATGFSQGHPYFCALIAVGVLAILMPCDLMP